MMRWEAGARYLGRGARTGGELQIALKQTENGARYVEAMLEVAEGRLQGERIRWRGYVNTRENAVRTVAELRAMGWRGTKWGDWAGFGTKVAQFTCLFDEGLGANAGKVYPRAAFVQEPAKLNDKGRLSDQNVSDLNRQFGDLLSDEPEVDVDEPYPDYEAGASADGKLPF